MKRCEQLKNRATIPYTYRCDLLGIENFSRETSRNREVLSISFSESRNLSRILSRLRFFLEKSPRSRSFITVANYKYVDWGPKVQYILKDVIITLLSSHKRNFRENEIISYCRTEGVNHMTYSYLVCYVITDMAAVPWNEVQISREKIWQWIKFNKQ